MIGVFPPEAVNLTRPTTMSDTPQKPLSALHSQQWFGRQDRDGFACLSGVKDKGVPHDQFDGRPVIGVCNTFSELTPRDSYFRTLAEQVKIGVYEAGGFPLELPVMSPGVLQADDQGVDLGFLVGMRGSFVPRDNH